MPKKLIADIYSGGKDIQDIDTEGAIPQAQPADATAMDTGMDPAMDAPAADMAPEAPAV
jgi:hypothetical protein